MKSLLLLLTLSLGMVVRYLRWFAFLQQKEYRFDRLRLFISTHEGKSELLRCIPKKSDFTRIGCKRPRLTPRMVIVMLVTAVGFVTGLLVLSALFVSHLPTFAVALLVYLAVFFVLAPAVVLLAAIPTSFLAQLITARTAQRARKKMAAHSPVVIGITGSYGKSSTKQLLSHLLSTQESVFATPKSYNTLLSIARSVLEGYQNQSIAIIEYGAYVPGEIARIAKYIRPQTALVTGFAPQHLGLFGSEQKIIDAKAELVAALQKNEKVYINGRSNGALQIAQKGSTQNQAEIIPVQWEDVFSNVSLNAEGKIECIYKGTRIKTQLVGKHYIENVALAWKVAEQYVSADELIAALESFQPTSSFIQSYQLLSGLQIIDDGGSSNPRGFEEAIRLLSDIPATKKIVITPGIVDLGEKSDEIHTYLAEKLLMVADQVLYVGDAGKAAMQAVLGDACIDSEEEISSILQNTKEDAIVLIEGRMPSWIQSLVQKNMRAM